MALLQLTAVVAVLAICVGISAHPHVFEGHDHQEMKNHGPEAPGPGPAGPGSRFWVPCNVTETPEPVCHDCHTSLVCTKLGGFLVPCWFPGQHHCAAGHCGPAPSDECAPSTTPSEPEPEETTTYQQSMMSSIST